MTTLRGGIICESLRPGTSLDVKGFRIRSWSRYEVSEPEWAPRLWTLIEFEGPAEASHALADQLSAALLEPGWYANWNTPDEATVVFPGKIFRYPRGDATGRAAAKEHGRRCGVPESQLDWDD